MSVWASRLRILDTASVWAARLDLENTPESAFLGLDANANATRRNSNATELTLRTTTEADICSSTGALTLAPTCLDIRACDWNNLPRGVSLDLNLEPMTHHRGHNSPQIVRFMFRDREQ